MKRMIEEGSYRVIASTEISEGVKAMPIKAFKEWLRHAEIRLKLIADSDVNAQIVVTGVGNAALQEILPIGENTKKRTIVTGFDRPAVSLVLEGNSGGHDESLLNEKEALLADTFIKVIAEANRIAELSTTTELDSAMVDEILKGNPHEAEIRAEIPNASKRRMKFSTMGGATADAGGKVKVPHRIRIGESYVKESCTIEKILISSNGVGIKSDNSEDIEFFHIKDDANTFKLLSSAHSFGLKCDFRLVKTGKFKKGYERNDFVEFINKKEVSKILIETIEFISQ